jgi:uncharacterized membrane protein
LKPTGRTFIFVVCQRTFKHEIFSKFTMTALHLLCYVLTLVQACHGYLPVSFTNRHGTARHHDVQVASETSPAVSSMRTQSVIRQRSQLAMGLLESMSNFLEKRRRDFIKLDDGEKEFGPGPLLLLYNVPFGIEDEEIQDILSDGAPIASSSLHGCRVYRLVGDDNSLLDLPLGECLEKIMGSEASVPESIVTTAATVTSGFPVLIFSGFRNDEMMATYNILGPEIHQEAGGQVIPACAKAVPNAMRKPLRQILEEIGGDHQDAVRSE